MSSSANPSSRSSRATSRSLIARVRANEAAAWERFVTLYAPLVYDWCRRAGLREQDTEDIFQEVFQAVLLHIRSLRQERRGDTFRGWLFTITRNKIRDHYRRENREPRGEGGTEAFLRLSRVEAPEPAGADVDDLEPGVCGDGLEDEPTADELEERALYHRALRLIREEFRETTWKAFWGTAVDDCPASDVARELGLTPGAVRVAKSRVLRRLREEMGDVR